MKTTIDIADDLLLRAKALAQRESMTLKDVTEQGLRLLLDQREPAPRAEPIKPFVVTGRGPAPDLSWDHLREVLYGDDDNSHLS
jgi:hypothetical protein